MPGCPRSCPTVKKQLRKQDAEKKKALEARLRPPYEDDEENVPVDRIVKNREEPTPADFDSGEKFELDSDHDSQERISEGFESKGGDFERKDEESRRPASGGRSSKSSVHNLSGRSSKDRNADRRQNRDETLRKSTSRESSDLGRSDGESRRPVEEDSGRRSTKNSGHYLSGRSSKDGNADRRKNRDETLGESSDLRRSDEESRRLVEEDSKYGNADRRKNRDETLSESSDFGRSDEESRRYVEEDSKYGDADRKNRDETLGKSSDLGRSDEESRRLVEEDSKYGNADRRKNRDETLGKSSDLGRSDEESRRLVEEGSKYGDADRRKNRDETLGESSDLGRSDEESRRLVEEDNKYGNADRRKNRDETLGESSDLGRSDGESRRPVEEDSNYRNADRRKKRDETLGSESSDLRRSDGEPRRPGNGGRSSRNSGHNLSGRSGKDRNEDRRKNQDGSLGSDSSDLGRSDGKSRRPGSGGRSSRNSGHSQVGRFSKDRNADRRKNRDGSLGSERSDFGGSDGESRGPFSRGRNKDTISRLSGNSSGKLRKDNAKARPSTSSANGERSTNHSDKYLSDQGFDPSKCNPCSSECSLRRLKEEMMRRKRAAKQNKGMHYFEDLCNCSATCLAKQLWNDPFVRKIFASAALFVFGIKLCWEMDAWYIPTQ